MSIPELNQHVTHTDLLGYYREAKTLGYAPWNAREYAVTNYARRNNKQRAEVEKVLRNILNGERVGSHVTC